MTPAELKKLLNTIKLLLREVDDLDNHLSYQKFLEYKFPINLEVTQINKDDIEALSSILSQGCIFAIKIRNSLVHYQNYSFDSVDFIKILSYLKKNNPDAYEFIDIENVVEQQKLCKPQFTVWHKSKIIYFFPNGSIYYGNGKFQNENPENIKQEGIGIYYGSTGDIYYGEFEDTIFINGQISGKGLYISFDGSKYEGTFKNGKKHGEGIYISFDGSKYEGKFKDGKKCGQGTEFYPNGCVQYIGGFKNNMKYGQGIYYNEDGSIFDGSWFNDKINGTGVLIDKNDNIFAGLFKNGKEKVGILSHVSRREKKLSRGILFLDNETKHDGDNTNDEETGYGTMLFLDGDLYSGDWVKGKEEGKGIIFYPNGNKQYEGEFKNGLFNGNGIYFFSNGERYNGSWQNGEMHGKGIYTFVNGNRYEGKFNCDKIDGSGKIFHPNGLQEKVLYKKGKKINTKYYSSYDLIWEKIQENMQQSFSLININTHTLHTNSNGFITTAIITKPEHSIGSKDTLLGKVPPDNLINQTASYRPIAKKKQHNNDGSSKINEAKWNPEKKITAENPYNPYSQPENNYITTSNLQHYQLLNKPCSGSLNAIKNNITPFPT